MRSSPLQTRALSAISAIVAAALAGPAWGSPPEAPDKARPRPAASAPQTPGGERQVSAEELLRRLRDAGRGEVDDSANALGRAIERYPDDAPLQLAWIDAALEREQYSTALGRIGAADGALRRRPEFQLRAAWAHFHLGIILGEARVRSVPDGRSGQFVRDWLLVEPRPGRARFLCSPPASALYQVRRALDAGLDDPRAYVLHARIWHRLGKPQIGLGILKSRAAVLLEEPDDDVLAAYCDLARAAGALDDYLRYTRRWAELRPVQRDAIMFAAYLAMADECSARGEEALYIQWLYRAARLHPGDGALLLRLADAEWAAQRPRQAQPLYRRVLRLEPDHPQRRRIVTRLAAPAAPQD